MRIVIIGATGATGKALVAQVLSDKHFTEVVALVRRKVLAEHPKLQQVMVQFDELDKYANHIHGDVAVSCLGTTLKDAGAKVQQWKIDYDYQLKFATIASKNGIPVFCLVSATGASAQSIFFYNRMKGQLEDAVKKLPFQTLNIFRPGMLLRPNTDRMMEKIAGKLLVMLDKLGSLSNQKPTPVNVLAAAIKNATLEKVAGIYQIEVPEIHHLAAKF